MSRGLVQLFPNKASWADRKGVPQAVVRLGKGLLQGLGVPGSFAPLLRPKVAERRIELQVLIWWLVPSQDFVNKLLFCFKVSPRLVDNLNCNLRGVANLATYYLAK